MSRTACRSRSSRRCWACSPKRPAQGASGSSFSCSTTPAGAARPGSPCRKAFASSSSLPTPQKCSRPRRCGPWSTSPSSTSTSHSRRPRPNHLGAMRRPRRRKAENQKPCRLPLGAQHRQPEVITRKPYHRRFKSTLSADRESGRAVRPSGAAPLTRAGGRLCPAPLRWLGPASLSARRRSRLPRRGAGSHVPAARPATRLRRRRARPARPRALP